MELNLYFDPVSLDRPAFHFLPEEYSFSRNIAIHTPDRPIKDLEKYQLALIGIPQDKNAFIKGSSNAPDKIRGMLYQLRKINNKLKVYDLGNLKITENINDTYYALRDILLELHEMNVAAFIIGGSQDLGYGVKLAMQKFKGIQHILTVDPRIDFWPKKEKDINSRNYLNFLLEKEKKDRFLYTNIAHQIYFVSEKQFDIIEKEFMESMRLGEIKEDIRKSEPLIRDADFVSVDMNAVRHSDAPGVTTPSPNGLFGDELCALLRYAGLSKKVKIAGLFECSPGKDLNNQTSHLAAQAIWYFIDGFTQRMDESPEVNPEHTTKFIVTLNELDHDLIFYKSNQSERWWMELPIKNQTTNQNFFISCSYEDYQLACKNIIPDRWWRYFQRLGN